MFVQGGTGSDNADIIAAFDATGGMRPLRRRSSQTRHRMFTFRQQSSFSLASMSTDSELDASKRVSSRQIHISRFQLNLVQDKPFQTEQKVNFIYVTLSLELYGSAP